MSTKTTLEDEYIQGLLVERAGHVQAGARRKERLAAVDAELKRVGYTGSKDATVDPHQEVLETASVDPVAEKATVKPKASKPRQATPAEEDAIKATTKAEAEDAVDAFNSTQSKSSTWPS